MRIDTKSLGAASLNQTLTPRNATGQITLRVRMQTQSGLQINPFVDLSDFEYEKYEKKKSKELLPAMLQLISDMPIANMKPLEVWLSAVVL